MNDIKKIKKKKQHKKHTKIYKCMYCEKFIPDYSYCISCDKKCFKSCYFYEGFCKKCSKDKIFINDKKENCSICKHVHPYKLFGYVFYKLL